MTKDLYVIFKDYGEGEQIPCEIVTSDINVAKFLFEKHKEVILDQLKDSDDYSIIEDKWDDEDYHNTMFHFKYFREEFLGFKEIECFLYIRKFLEIDTVQEYEQIENDNE